MTGAEYGTLSHESYHAFRGLDGIEYGSFEVLWSDGKSGTERGWWWWACFPGCLPDGDPMGPFDTILAALQDAQGGGIMRVRDYVGDEPATDEDSTP